MNKLILASAALLAACAGAPPAATPKAAPAARVDATAPIDVSPAQRYAQARERMAAKDWAGARAELDAFLAQDPTTAAASFDAGWVAEQLGDRGRARDHYRKALQNAPEHLGAALNLARLLRHDEQLPAAERVLREALAKRAGDPQLLNALSGLLRQQGKLDEAEAAVQKILLRHQRDPGAYQNLALIEMDRGRLRLAEAALETARKLDDRDAGILNNLGILAARRDDLPAARARFEEAVKLDPALAAAWANLGSLELQYRNYRSAADAYAKATQLDASRWELNLAYAWALDGLKKPKEAREQYDRVLAARPDHQEAMFGRALALKAEGNLPEAMKAFQAYVQVPWAARAKDAQAQIALIDLRLKNQAPAAKKKEVKAGADLSALPAGSDEAGQPAADLPADEPEQVPTANR